MNTQQVPSEFCFRCATKNHDADTQRSPLPHNPWPLLVSSDWRIAQTQPLTRIIYHPSDIRTIQHDIVKKRFLQHNTCQVDNNFVHYWGSKHTGKDRDDFEDYFIWQHELIHLNVLDKTPAKDVAKFSLARIYDNIASLMFKESIIEVENAWNNFKELEIQLNQISKRIAFIEELLATAIAIYLMRKEVMSACGVWIGFQEELTELEQKVLLAQEQIFPGFRESYSSIQQRIGIIYNGIFTNLLPLIQSIKVNAKESFDDVLNVDILDPRENLDQILKILDKIMDNASNAIEAYQSLSSMVERDWFTVLKGQFLNAYKHKLSDKNKRGVEAITNDFIIHKAFPFHVIQHSIGQDTYLDRIFQAFWSINHVNHDNLFDYTENKFKEFIHQSMSNNFSQDNPCMILYRKKYKKNWYTYRKHWYIEQELKLSDHGTSNPYGFPNPSQPGNRWDSYNELLLYEAIRQQLVAGKGIICPFQDPKGHCHCNSVTHKGLLRLSHLAKDYLFGRGEWSLLPCRR